MLCPRPKLAYFGASPDTGNSGVSALCYAVVGSLARLNPAVDLTVFDEGTGVRSATAQVDGKSFRYSLCGATETRRVWQRRSLWNIRVSNWLGGLGNPAVACLRSADAVLDISGGDSFTDLYGPRRFHSVTFAKRLALQHGRPLILLPQTYGPYRSPRCRAVAAEIVRRAAQAWARDARSFAVLQDLLGSAFDPQRHRCGVDVAFALQAQRPHASLPPPLADWLAEAAGKRTTPLVGFNVSGLIWNDPVAMRQRYGFKADYRDVVLGVLRRVLLETDARVLLVPHVFTPPGHYESDPGANEQVLAALRTAADVGLARAAAERLAASPQLGDDPGEMKWLVAQCDWFCGTRMHACIAGLSSGVPTAAIAYSAKTQGVFETVGQGDAVVDPRELEPGAAVARRGDAFLGRAVPAAALAARLPAVRGQAVEQLRSCFAVSERSSKVGVGWESVA